ncbi:MAG: glycoside hydrolase family 3 N-terminal domain-containing protein, partial [Cytophagales bacterium]
SFAQSFEKKQSIWVDSIFNTLNPDQKLGQLFMIAAYSNQTEVNYQKIDSLVGVFGVGGLIFFQGGPVRQALLTNRYNAKAKIPLLIGMDAEWGIGMRLMDSTISFPRQMTLGASQNPTLAYKMGAEIAKHCKRLGVHINFAPSVDVNNNPDNPVIGIRSFGEEKEKVAEFGLAYMKGMQENGIMASAKHFPGHGDTDADSHFSLPVINHDKKRLNDLELYPFKKLIAENVMSIMVAHIHIPAYDNRPNIATTLSPKVVNDLLKKQLRFKGLVITDALNMKGVAKYYAPGEVEYQALLAGNDVLLFAEDVPTSILKIKEAFANGKLDSIEIYERVKKILRAKYWSGLSQNPFIDTTNIYQDLNSNASKAIRNELYAQSLTLLKNEKKTIPFKTMDINTFASVAIGFKKNSDYHQMLDNYAPFTHFVANKNTSDSVYDKLIDSLSNFSRVIVSLHDLNNRKKENYGISDNTLSFIKKLQSKTNVTIVHFGNLYALRNFEFAQTLICAFEDNEATRTTVPQMLFGALPIKGKLPVSISPAFKLGDGINLNQKLDRLAYAFPENLSISSTNFYELDSILDESIKDGSTPGMQILVVKNGKVIYRKNKGFHSYDKLTPVTNNTVYDIASVTKVAATMQAVMFLNDWGKLDVNSFLVDYLPELKGSNKEKLILSDVMVHQAGLLSYADFWRKTMVNDKLSDRYYSPTKSKAFPNQASNQWFSSSSLPDSVWRWTIQTSLSTEKADTGCYAYKYSDLTFSFLKRIAEKQLNQTLPDFLAQNVYKPLGLRTLTYNPLTKLSVNSIPPTEEDKTFRLAKIQGTVHDQNASLVGGVAGHAGLFGNANDLAILGQMLLQKGTYGGTKYFNPETIELFTRQQYTNNRRALGWDRPFPPDEISLASPEAFGHTGFTGTAWWIDPKEQLVFVLLTNRTYPFAENKRWTEKSVRTKALNAVYKAIRD